MTHRTIASDALAISPKNQEAVQLWSNSLNFSTGVLKKRPDAFTLTFTRRKFDI